MTQQTFITELTLLCVKALNDGIITVKEFQLYTTQWIQPNPKAATTSKKRTEKRTAQSWTFEMFEAALANDNAGLTFHQNSKKILVEQGRSVSYRAIQTMIWKVREGRLFYHEKYRAEPFRTLLVNERRQVKEQ